MEKRFHCFEDRLTELRHRCDKYLTRHDLDYRWETFSRSMAGFVDERLASTGGKAESSYTRFAL
jgi:hypothetical protein